MNLLYALLNTVLPIFLLAGLGWFARRQLGIEVKDPSRLAIYIFSPSLAVYSILTAKLAADEIGKILAFGLLLMLVLIIITLVIGLLLGWRESLRSAAVLNTAFMNAGNYGLPIILLAFGQAGFERGAVLMILQSLLMYSVGAYFAARGHMGWRPALAATLKLPMLWAALVALLIRFAQVPMPDAVMKPLGMMANGGLVLAVILLGMQVANLRLAGGYLNITIATLLRLVLSPVVSLGLVALLQPDPLTAKVLILEAAMPAAVVTTLLAVQFETEPDLVAGGTLVTTIASLATVSFWVWYLQGPSL